MNVMKTVELAYVELLSRTPNARQRTSLERIKAACDYLEANDIRISLSAIDGYCTDRKWDGPKAQSIRNSKEVLKWYVDLRSSGQKVQPRTSKRPSAEPDIADESLRAYVRLLKEERDQAFAAKVRIEAGLRSIPGIPVDDLIRGKFNPGSLPGPGSTATRATVLPPPALEALRALFDEGRLRSCGLEMFRDRIRHSTTHNVLLEKSEVEALRALAAPTKT